MLRTVLFVFLAAAAGVILFTTIQDELPEELSWLKNSGKPAGAPVDQAGHPLPSKLVQQHKSWTVYSDDTRVVLSRTMQGRTEVKAQFYFECALGKDAPEIRLIPYVGKEVVAGLKTVSADWSYEAPEPPAGEKPKEKTPQWIGVESRVWPVEEGRMVLAKPENVLSTLASGGRVKVVMHGLSKRKPESPFTMDAKEFPYLTQSLPAHCR